MPSASTLAVLVLLAAPALAQAQPADRYGPAPAAYAGAPYGGVAANAQPAPAPLRGRVLSWPGKASALQPPPSPGYGPSAYAPSVYAPPAYSQPAARPGYARTAFRAPAAGPAYDPSPRYAPRAMEPGVSAPQARAFAGPPVRQAYAQPRPQAVYAAPFRAEPPQGEPSRWREASVAQPSASPAAQGWRPVYAAGAPSAELAGAPQPGRAAPTSIYAPAPSATDPVAARVAAAPPPRGAPADRRYGYDPTAQHSVRFYSVSRPFGLKPDPAPIPPQFFTNTADLSDPPGPLPLERSGSTVTSAGRTVRATPDTSAN